ncbi:MAG: ATP-binding cassette domain-containing protein [Firmicutes bacterium]|nr:ATP-binding cassette domain-containing protein [Bacillota bacterium]
MIILKNISKIYHNKNNKTEALKNISLKLPSKGLIIIVGASGSGKTTLLNILGKLDKITTGEVIYEKTNLKSSQLLYEEIAIIDQEDIFLEGLDVVDNIRLFSNIQGRVLSNHEVLKEMKSIGLENCVNRQINELSAGQKQRVSFLRSIMKEFSLLIADEPSANLDDVTEMVLFNKLKEISKDKLVITVTHNRNLASNISDRIIEIRDGVVIYDVNSNEENTNQMIIDNDIIFLKNDIITDASQWSIINALLLEKKELKLRIIEEQEVECLQQSNIEESESPIIKKQRINNRTIKMVILNKTRTKGLKMIFNSLLFSILMFSIYLVYLVMTLNKIDLLHTAIVDNHIPYTIMSVEEDLFSTQYIDIQQDYSFLNTNSSGSVSGLIDNDFYIENQYPLSFYDTDRIYGFVIYNGDIDVIYGNLPTQSEFLMSDYIADFLISQGIAGDYEDIISNDIILGDDIFSISGIMRTTANKYSMLDTDEENIIGYENIILKDEFQLNRKYIYARLYLPISNIDQIIDRGLINHYTFQNVEQQFNISVYNGEYVTDIINSVDHKLYIPQALYADMMNRDIPLYLKTRGNNILITGYYDDEFNTNNIYMDFQSFQTCVNDYYSINHILVETQDLETLSYFLSKGYSFNNYIAADVSFISFSIDLIKTNKTAIITSMILIFILVSLNNIRNNISSDNKSLYLLKANGFSKYNINALYIYESILFIASFSIILFMLILTFSNGINNILTTHTVYNLQVIRFTTGVYFKTILLSGAIIVIEYIYFANKIYSRNIINLRKGNY